MTSSWDRSNRLTREKQISNHFPRVWFVVVSVCDSSSSVYPNCIDLSVDLCVQLELFKFFIVFQ